MVFRQFHGKISFDFRDNVRPVRPHYQLLTRMNKALICTVTWIGLKREEHGLCDKFARLAHSFILLRNRMIQSTRVGINKCCCSQAATHFTDFGSKSLAPTCFVCAVQLCRHILRYVDREQTHLELSTDSSFGTVHFESLNRHSSHPIRCNESFDLYFETSS